MLAAVVGLALLVLLLGVLVVGLLQSHSSILRALHDLGADLERDGTLRRSPTRAAGSTSGPQRTAEGVPLPPDLADGRSAVDLDGALPGGGAAHVAVAGDNDTLIAFLSTGCGTCMTFWDELAVPGAAEVDGTRVVIVTNGEDSESPAAVAALAPPEVVTVMSTQAWNDYGVPVSPYFVLVDGATSTVTGEGSGTSWGQVLELLGRATADAEVRGRRNRARPTRLRGQDRADLVDAQLRAAGIEPGDPSLYPSQDPAE